LKPSIIASIALAFAIGCGPAEPEPPGLETESLRFHGELDGACGALGVLYERELDRIEHELGRGVLEPVDVYVGDDEIDGRCPAGTSMKPSTLAGCTVSGTEVATTLDALSRQLVHAVRLQHEVRGIPFIEGALVSMIGTGRPSLGYVMTVSPDPDHAIGPQLAHDWSQKSLVDGGVAVHFLHWVEQAYGSKVLQAWLWSDAVREGNGVEAAFTEATGQTIAVAEERWSDEAELDARFAGLCHGIDAPPLPPEGLLVQAPACCDAPGVEQAYPPLLNLGHRCFTLPTETEVDVELLAGDGTLELRADGCLASPHSPVLLQPGEATTLSMSACRWQVMVVGPEHCEAGQEVRYAITPS
jgi:hypothetical protein